MTGFRNPIIAGSGALIRPAIMSPNYVPGVSGWAIFKDGSSEFANSTVRGMIEVGDPAGSHMILDPDVQIGFNDGFVQAVLRMFPDDPNFMMEGMLAVVTFSEGAVNAEMATILHSPIENNGNGYALALAADSDDLTRNAHAAIGPVTANGDAMSFTGLHMIEDYGISTPAHLSYASQPGQVVENFNMAGTFNWTAPPGVTAVQIECWGAGGRGAPKGATLGGCGGGGGEYTKRGSASVTPGNVYAYTVGAGGNSPGVDGGDTTITTNVSTTTGHGGKTGTGSGGAAGGTGSPILQHNGGNGAATVFRGGGGGGGAGGTNNVGTVGFPGNADNVHGGVGGSGGSLGGGSGGKGGDFNGAAGAKGNAPGGGGGGQGQGASAGPGNGADGQLRLTYTPAVVPIAASQAAMSGTDRFGNAYPAGFAFGGKTVPDASRFSTQEGIANSTQALTTTRTDVTSMTVTFTTVAPNTLVLVSAQWDVTISAGVAGTGNVSVGEVVVDGAIRTEIAVGQESNTERGVFNLAMIPVVLATPGSHTIKGTIRKNGTATAAISAGNGTFITCLVLDFFS